MIRRIIPPTIVTILFIVAMLAGSSCSGHYSGGVCKIIKDVAGKACPATDGYKGASSRSSGRYFETEPNNSSNQANSLNDTSRSGHDYTGHLSSGGDKDWFVVLKPEGVMGVEFICTNVLPGQQIHVDLYDEGLNWVTGDWCSSIQLNTQVITPRNDVGRQEGTWYLKVSGSGGLNYTLSPLLVPDASSWTYYESERNDKQDVADAIDDKYDGDTDGVTMTGIINPRDDTDWFKFTVDRDGYLVVFIGCTDFSRSDYLTANLYWESSLMLRSNTMQRNREFAPLAAGLVRGGTPFYVKIKSNNAWRRYNLEVILHPR